MKLTPAEIKEVKRSIQSVRIASQKMRECESRYAAHKFLTAVYVVYQRWRGKKAAGRLSRAAAILCGIQPRQDHTPLRRLIELGCDQDKKTKSRWTRALEYVASENIPASELVKCFTINSGIAGCARMAAMNDPRKRTERDDWK